jgi:hypothetical protein
MKPKLILCLALVLCGALYACSCASAQSPTNNVDDATQKQDEGAKEHFKDYLAKCDTNEIRCLWFLDDKPEVGMVMTINIESPTNNRRLAGSRQERQV